MSRSSTEVSSPLPAQGYVLPSPPRGHGDLVIVPPASSGLALRRGGQVARTLGARFEVLAECQEQFLVELRTRLETLDSAIAEDSRARLKGLLREATDLLGWCEAVQADAHADSRRAALGKEPIDVADLCRDLAGECGTPDSPVVVQGGANLPWWGEAARFAELVRVGLALVAERTGGHGARLIEVSGQPGGAVEVRLAGVGVVRDAVEPTLVGRFRDVADALGATVEPDHLGAGGAGMILRLAAGG